MTAQPSCLESLRRFMVGGAVRDRLLGRPVHDRDWVVLNETPESMVARGFQPVGNDFPIFLHPETREEHALARQERKRGRGYQGFTFHTRPDVTLEEDLYRRDLTVNAIAQSPDGTLHDPHGGQADLEARVLRHVSAAFREDPLRVLRVARFAAQLAPLGFTIAPETLALMREIADAGELEALSAERVWAETEKALDSSKPSLYFDTLLNCGALARLMPELAELHGVPQRAEYHPEVDTFVHVMMCVDHAARAGMHRHVRIAALLHDLGKGLTPRAEWPAHRGHEGRGVKPVQAFCRRLRVPLAPRDLAIAVSREHLKVHRVMEMRPGNILLLLEVLGAFSKGDRFEHALQACECDARGRLGFEECDYPSPTVLREAADVARAVPVAGVIADGFEGVQIRDELHQRRQRALTSWKRHLVEAPSEPGPSL